MIASTEPGFDSTLMNSSGRHIDLNDKSEKHEEGYGKDVV
jgi:hypothetical protein